MKVVTKACHHPLYNENANNVMCLIYKKFFTYQFNLVAFTTSYEAR